MLATGMSSLEVIVQFLLVLVPFAVVFTIVWIVMVVLQANASDALTQFEETLEAAREEDEAY